MWSGYFRKCLYTYICIYRVSKQGYKDRNARIMNFDRIRIWFFRIIDGFGFQFQVPIFNFAAI